MVEPYPSEKYDFVGITILVYGKIKFIIPNRWKHIHYQMFHVPDQLSNSPAKVRPNAAYPLHPVLSQGSQASFSLRSLTFGRTGKPTWKSTSVLYLLILEGNTRFTQNPSVRKTLLSFVWWKPGEFTSFRQVLDFHHFTIKRVNFTKKKTNASFG